MSEEYYGFTRLVICFVLEVFGGCRIFARKKKKRMKRMVILTALMGAMVMNGRAQVGAYDTYVELPVVDLYGGMLNANTARMMAELDARKKEQFEYYQQEAQKAIGEKNWWRAIRCVNEALQTGYENSYVYYLKGFAFERAGDLKNAKKAYKKAKRKGSLDAIQGLARLREQAQRKYDE